MPALSKYKVTFTTVLGTALAAALLSASPMVLATKNNEDSRGWGDWKSMGGGYVGRRREPAAMILPATERRSASVDISEKNKKNKGQNKSKQPKSEFESALQPQNLLEFQSFAAADSAITTAKALWFYTDVEGIYRVPLTDIAASTGKAAEHIRNKAKRGKLSLQNAGSTASWHFDAASDSLLFVGESYATFYSDINAYRLRIPGADRHRSPMRVTTGAPSSLGSPASFTDTLTFEEEPDFQFVTSSVAADPDADYWFWRAIWAGYPGSDSTEVDLQIPNPANSGAAQLRITLRGGTNLEQGMEHHVTAEINGTAVGEITFDGFEEAVLVATGIQGLLDPAGSNTLRLSNTSDGSHPIQYLDKVEVDYTRLPVAGSGKLWLHNVAAGTQTVSGFDSDQIMVVESPGGQGVLRQDVIIEPGENGDWAVTFDTSSGLDYLVSQHDKIALASVLPDYPTRLNRKSNMADYLIIAPRAFAQTARELADYRSARYSYVELVWLDDIYDEFSHGREDPAAITAFMERVQKRWDVVPSFVTIIGKGSLDHKDRMGFGDSFVPVRMASTPWALAASDDRLLAVDERSSFAIGRLPITNDLEGQAYVAKLIAYEAGNYGTERFEAVLVADNTDDAGDFQRNSDQLAEQLSYDAGFNQVSKLYHPQDEVRTSLIQSSTWETGYVSYDGHGSTSQVGNGKENFINATDANLLQNTVYPVFSALTCAAGDDTMPGPDSRSLAGALVLNPSGGAIASMAPTGLSLDGDAQALGSAFVDSLFAGMNTIGGAVLDAKTQTAGSISDFMPGIYSVVGDPAVFAR